MTTISPPELPAALSRVHEIVTHWATHTPQAPAVSDSQQALNYEQFAGAIERAAEALRRRNVRPGDRIAIVTENNVTAAVLMFAAQRLEAWPAIINARVGAHEIEALQACAAARLTLYALDGSQAVEKLVAARANAEPFMDAHIGALRVTATVASDPEPVHADPANQVALLLFTSGTTGRPKAVMLSHAGLMQLGAVLAVSRRTTPKDSYNGVAPLSHIMGQANLMCALSCGASVQLMPRLEVPSLAQAIARGDITHLSFVPTVYARLIEYATTNKLALQPNRLRYISSGGAPLDPLLKERVETLLGVPLVNGYGMTECAPGARTRPEIKSPADSIGWPEDGVEARIVASEGSDCPSGEIGELWLRSATRMLGYYRNPEETAAALRPEGWFATGDLVRRLADGQIAIVGRKKEMIIRSGFNVYPAEVEAALNRLPQIVQSGVVGRPTSDGNEEVIAFVQLRPGESADAAALLEQLRPLIAPYKRPQHLIILDALPLVSTGKIWKAKLVEMARALA